MKYLGLYKKWMMEGKLPRTGLCCSINNKTIERFEPTELDYAELQRKGLSTAYWGSGFKIWHPDREHSFTPLRQNIVLFLAAMNGEL